MVDFFVRNCLLYENSSKNVDFHVPSCSGSHPGWFHLAWGSNDGIWYRCRPPSANECSFSALARHQPRNPWKCQQLALYHHQRHQQLYINNEREQLSNRTVFQAVTNIDQPFVSRTFIPITVGLNGYGWIHCKIRQWQMLTLEYSNFLPPVLPVSPLLLSFADSKTKTEVSPASIPLFGVCFNSASSVDIYIINGCSQHPR